MKRLASALIALLIFFAPLSSTSTLASAPTSVIPTFSIVTVATDVSVTILTYNFPAYDNFLVRMGPMGTRGEGGIPVATINSGVGGSFYATFAIPAALAGSYQIAIRLENTTGSGYYAYNWFYNNTAAPPIPGPGYGGIPTFTILAVERDVSVTIQTNNFPAGDTFDVLMNYIGTQGIAGLKVATVNSGAGGSFIATFPIPDPLKGLFQIAIRLQSPYSGYYAYNWFYNNTTGGSGGIPPGYFGYPTFFIAAVVRNVSVTIITNNLPPNDNFVVQMGYMGTRAIGGYVVATFNSGAGGSQSLTFSIPPQLYNQYQIAIRFQSPTTGYYAYNWFYNNTYP